MNSNTRTALRDFITAVENLTAGVQHEIGTQLASEICTVCEELKDALNKDETIP